MRRGVNRILGIAFVWSTLFALAHLYWYAGGRFGLGDAPSPLPGRPTNLLGWTFTILVTGMFVVGVVLPALLLRGRLRERWHGMAAVLLWVGAVVLALRGASGVLDDLLRQTGLADDGLTGLSYQATLGTSAPSERTLISTDAIDGYFLLGGVVFGVAAWSQWSSRRARPARRAGSPGRGV